jgi:serine/threonine-protein phosphatase 2A activator
MLDDISAVKTWDKVNSGMIKMYIAEVLGKLPVMQHFLFGSILPYEGPPPTTDSEHDAHSHDGHSHPHPGVQAAPGQTTKLVNGKVINLSPPSNGDEPGNNYGGDCCGIPVPSAFGAAEAAKNSEKQGWRIAGPGIRPVPFD